MKHGSLTICIALAAICACASVSANTPPSQDSGEQTFHFKLTRGQGVAVCEAYLQRLDQTKYSEPPYCGRPENDEVAGFARLQRVLLTPREVTALYWQIDAFWQHGKSVSLVQLDPTQMAAVSRAVTTKDILVWRYEPPVNIENNGMPANVIVWRGGPVSSVGKPCGYEYLLNDDRASAGYVQSQLAFVLSPDSAHVDHDKTKAIFGHPTGGHSVPEPTPYLDTGPGYKALGNSMSVFQYQGKIYFDTFFEGDGWADFEGKRANLKTLRNHLGVFLREKSATKQICEYVFNPKGKTSP